MFTGIFFFIKYGTLSIIYGLQAFYIFIEHMFIRYEALYDFQLAMVSIVFCQTKIFM